MHAALRILGFVLCLLIWRWVGSHAFAPPWGAGLAVGGVLLVFPASRIARSILDAGATLQRAQRVTPFLHYFIMIALGSAVIESVKMARASPRWIIPLPPGLGWGLTVATGIVVALTVGSLALRGLGTPFAIYLSRRLAASGMYAWTRNPMVLSLLAFFVSFGLWTRSGLFVAWTIGLFLPAMVYYLKTYEERELEIRFGQGYLAYKVHTPLLWPRKPRPR
jgi:protein-S-isoprenylcysteine O-methyltransferase Ste14